MWDCSEIIRSWSSTWDLTLGSKITSRFHKFFHMDRSTDTGLLMWFGNDSNFSMPQTVRRSLWGFANFLSVDLLALFTDTRLLRWYEFLDASDVWTLLSSASGSNFLIFVKEKFLISLQQLERLARFLLGDIDRFCTWIHYLRIKL